MIPLKDWVMQFFSGNSASPPRADQARVMCAAHEIGHAMVADSEPYFNVTGVSINDDGGLATHEYRANGNPALLHWGRCAAVLGGIAGEITVFGRFRSGESSQDLTRALSYANWLTGNRTAPSWQDVGTATLPFQRIYAGGIGGDTEQILQVAYRRARRIIGLRANAFRSATDELVRHGRLSPNELRRLLGSKPRL